MNAALSEKLIQVLGKIDRPGSFCVSGSVPIVLPGLEVEGFGPVGLPLNPRQATELKKHCEQAPYGKGEETLVDPSVRRVWRMKPERFSLTNPDWQQFIRQTVDTIQQELGLEKQKLESHLYDLLLYEPGSFFLPHRDGEKLERMVATLVVVFPSSFQGGELVVRHDGQERTFDFGGGNNLFHIHFAAFYADCEHEIRPLREGYRLCLVYNLTLAKSKRALRAPRSSEHIEPITQILREWATGEDARRLAITLEHQYTVEGLTWDALKGADAAKARVLFEAANRAGYRASLALLTLHESGSAEYSGSYRRRSRWEDEDDPEQYEMGEVYDTTLTAEHWSDSKGERLPLGSVPIGENEILDQEWLQKVDPEENVEGYTGNEGMTFDRWYRRAAIFLWPHQRHFDILCDAGSSSAVQALEPMVTQWQQSGPKDTALQVQCIDFAATIIARWGGNPRRSGFGYSATPIPLLPLLDVLDDPALIKGYLAEVLSKDTLTDPGEALSAVIQKHGWGTFQRELEVVFKSTMAATIERNVRLLEQICLVKPRKKEAWLELCTTLAQAILPALETIDQENASNDFWPRKAQRAEVLTGLARSMLVTEQFELLSRLVAHALARPKEYPLTSAHMSALTTLQPWLKKNVKKPCAALSQWIDACRKQLEALTAQAPQAPTDLRRTATISCKCADCGLLRTFLDNPTESVYRFRAREDRRRHLEQIIGGHKCDLDLKTERGGSPHVLVCTKNSATYQAQLKKYLEDQEHLAMLRSIQESLPK